MSEDYTESQVEKFVNALTAKVFAQFYYACQARAHLKPELLYGTKDGLSRVEIDLCLKGEKILAIREYRSRTGTGLKEAKDAIDNWCTHNLEAVRKLRAQQEPVNHPFLCQDEIDFINKGDKILAMKQRQSLTL